MDYFNLDDKDDYLNNVGETYSSDSEGTAWYFDTREKLRFLITLIEENLHLNLAINYNEKPNGMAGQGKGFKLKHYVLCGFIENKFLKKIDKSCFIKVQFYEQNDELYFSTDIDVNFSDSKNKFNHFRDELQKSSSHFWKVDENFPKDWDGLINLILPIVSSNILHLNNFITKKILPVMEKNAIESLTVHTNRISLNQILYGPPGTGKTYGTINKSLDILGINGEGLKRKELKDLFDERVKDGQIVFTTFHQSMSYEDFIEGIKPLTKNEKVTYSVQDGTFKSLVKKALIEYIKEDSDREDKDDFDALYSDYIIAIKPLEGIRQATFTTIRGVEVMLFEANDTSILVKYLWRDNKKDVEGQHIFRVTKDKLKKVLAEGLDPASIKSLRGELKPLVGHIHSELFAVYKNFYDFAVANKGEIETIHFNYENLSFEEVKEKFDLLTKEEIAAKKVKPFIIIIDEINRGNVSQIFGELITLIEDDKRLGNDEALEVTLPYSKNKFGVPSNVYIIGTMNTADRSVEALDTALRRRFCFEEILSDPTIIATLGDASDTAGIIENIDLPMVLKTINSRIEVLSNRDHIIGHTYFMRVTSLEDLKDTFKNNIIPLLQEYFYNDYSKIGLVIGEGFFEEKKVDKKSIFNKFFKTSVPDFDISFQLACIDDVDIKVAMQKLLGTFTNPKDIGFDE